MPNAGDKFVTTLKRAHLEWGNFRHTRTRKITYGEGYLQIPSIFAYNYNITNNKTIVRSPEYDFSTSDNFITNGKLLAAGNQYLPEYAKQFQGSGSLKLLGSWFSHINAQIGDQIEIRFITATELLLTPL
ncbi:hypothetical protein ACFSJW_24100 [Flavobacterium artemisiae]|uniref:Uncharacterized protein n=1 Tax=Flavobacterium artemisiae TaxID=2126556 RepID=A0ABW4H9J5_9FLAO